MIVSTATYICMYNVIHTYVHMDVCTVPYIKNSYGPENNQNCICTMYVAKYR